jgi:O-methyltransferase involved in polyketide biosynthesis
MDSLEQRTDAYDKISPTAWGVAYRRTLAEIPFSKEIFDELDKIMRRSYSAEELQEFEVLKHPEAAPIIEARFRLVSRLVKASGSKQIFEIAAGFSSRGIEMAQDPSVEFVEADLPGVINDKRDIVETLAAQSKVPREPNLHLVDGNALNARELLTAVIPFRQEPITVVTEGLLRYLDFKEKAIVAANVHQLLERFGGVWITPDLSEGLFGQSAEKIKERHKRMKEITGADLTENRFKDEQSAREFFENLGFVVERHSCLEVLDETVSPQKLGLSKDQTQTILKDFPAFVMRLCG